MPNCPDPCMVELTSAGGGGLNSFTPPSVTINTGTTVIWTYNDVADSADHTVTSGDNIAYVPDGVFDSGFGDLLDTLGETFQHTFNVAGTFPYHCGVHTDDMQGTVTVLP